MSIITLNTIVVLIWTGFVVLNLWLWLSSPRDCITESQRSTDDSHHEEGICKTQRPSSTRL